MQLTRVQRESIQSTFKSKLVLGLIEAEIEFRKM